MARRRANRRSQLEELEVARNDVIPVERNPVRKTIQPKEYTTGPWSDYVSYFNTVSTLNGWSNDIKVLYLSISLTGESLSIFNSLDPAEREDFDALCESIKAKLDPPERLGIKRDDFLRRVQGSKESLTSYAVALKNLYRDCFEEQFNETHKDFTLTEQFVKGLRDESVRLQVSLSRPETIDSALTKALEVEATFAHFKPRPVALAVDSESHESPENVCLTGSAPSTSQDHVELRKAIEAQAGQISELCRAVKQLSVKSPSNRDRPRRRCWLCGESGHVQSGCTKKQGN